MKRAKNTWTAVVLLGAMAGLSGCSSTSEVVATASEHGSEWVESSHGNVASDTAQAFPDTVRTLTVELSASDWASLASSLTLRCGAFGSGSSSCTGSSFDAVDASGWLDATVRTDGQTWLHVGMKLRGNSELVKAWEDSSLALPFKFSMDKWEDSFSTIKNQRFYGFQKLQLTSLRSDSSGLRERLAGAMLRQVGVPAPYSAPVRVILVLGTQRVDAGLYSMAEAVDGPLLKRSFGESTGNLYEPSSSFQLFNSSDFEGDDNDGTYSDVKNLYFALHAATRTTAPAQWRSDLKSVFDVDGFLKWLAVNTAIRNTESYGTDANGYFLYNKAGVLEWGAEGLVKTFKPATALNASVWHPAAGELWPVISYVLADSLWCHQYKSTLTGLRTTILTPSNLQALAAKYSGSVTASQSSASAGIASLTLTWTDRLTQIDTSLAAHTCP